MIASGVFGLPLGKAVPPGEHIPVVLEHSLQVLSFCTPANPDLFDLPITHPEVESLRTAFDQYDQASGLESPIAKIDNPQVIAALILLYFRCLPHPVVPPKFYITFLRIGAIPHSRTRYSQLRVMLHKLPAISRAVVVRVSSWLRSTTLPPDRLAPLFAKFVLRPTNDHGGEATATPTAATRLVQQIVEQADFMALLADEPALKPEEESQLVAPVPGGPSDFRLESVALYDFRGGEGQISFSKGDRVFLLSVYQDDWLEGQIGDSVGFLPAAYVDIVPFNPSLQRLASTSPSPAASAPASGPPSPTGVTPPLTTGLGASAPVVVHQNPAAIGSGGGGGGGNGQPGHQAPAVSPAGTVPSSAAAAVAAAAPGGAPFVVMSAVPSQGAPSSLAAFLSVSGASSPVVPETATPPVTPPAGRGARQIPGFNVPPPPAPETPAHPVPAAAPAAPASSAPAAAALSPLTLVATPGAPSTLKPLPTPPGKPLPVPAPATSPGVSISKSPKRPAGPTSPTSSTESLPPPVAPLVRGNRAGSAALGTPATAGPATDEYHVVIVGSGGVGKSAMTVLFVHDYFVEQYDPTIEDSYRKQIPVDGVPCLLHLLDTAGQEDYSAMRDQYMKRGQGFLVVFSVTKRSTFAELETIRQRILRAKDRDQVPMVFAGNKIDLADERQVQDKEAIDFCSKFKCPLFFTSAKTRTNIDESFSALVREIRKDPVAKAGNNAREKRFRKCTIL